MQIVGGYLAKQKNFDVIHAHDWLTYPAGVAAKQISGKPLDCTHACNRI
jgi:glycogen synthase